MIIFRGKISSGLGRHSELIIPGKHNLTDSPVDWPEEFATGSLNVQIVEFPEALKSTRTRLKALDRGVIPPTLVIPQDRIENNSLRRKFFKPRRGMASNALRQVAVNASLGFSAGGITHA